MDYEFIYDLKFDNDIAALGDFPRFDEIMRGVEIVLMRNPSYWPVVVPTFKKIRIIPVNTMGLRLKALMVVYSFDQPTLTITFHGLVKAP